MFGRQFHLVAIIICSRNISIWISVEHIFVAVVVVVIRHRLIHNRHAVFVFYCCHTGILICLLLFLIRSSLSTIRNNMCLLLSCFPFFDFFFLIHSNFSFVTAFLFPAWFLVSLFCLTKNHFRSLSPTKYFSNDKCNYDYYIEFFNEIIHISL